MVLWNTCYTTRVFSFLVCNWPRSPFASMKRCFEEVRSIWLKQRALCSTFSRVLQREFDFSLSSAMCASVEEELVTHIYSKHPGAFSVPWQTFWRQDAIRQPNLATMLCLNQVLICAPSHRKKYRVLLQKMSKIQILRPEIDWNDEERVNVLYSPLRSRGNFIFKLFWTLHVYCKRDWKCHLLVT